MMRQSGDDRVGQARRGLLENDLSPRSGTDQFRAIRAMAGEIGIAISGVCSFLYWPYSLTDNDPKLRARGLELATKMIRAAHDLGKAGSISLPTRPGSSAVIPNT